MSPRLVIVQSVDWMMLEWMVLGLEHVVRWMVLGLEHVVRWKVLGLEPVLLLMMTWLYDGVNC